MEQHVVRLTAEQVLGPSEAAGEGPFWDARVDRLGWVDIERGQLHLTDPRSGADDVLETGVPLGAAAPTGAEGYVLALADGFAHVDAPGDAPRYLARVDDDAGRLRMNDGKCDPQGRFWAGTMAYDVTPGAGSLYRLDIDGSVTTVLTDVTISNGLDWSPDGSVMHYVDSMTGRVERFTVDPASGELADRSTLVDLGLPADDSLVVPDGLTLDAQGCVWVAVFGGECVRRYSPAGQLLAVVDLPGRTPTSCAFGGPDLGDLFITFADRRPYAPLAVCRPGVVGLPTRCYR